eukprot:TRINITY_DN389_c1_g2_i1.p1 TRINITY_DN389_c1_g2~~TRINITY_DN389_c1_g2_i1.p1  ORF type:complete len:728 (+),score=235.71 TRINITY_DN389_c1_g2_i1:124-2307(+)
MAAMPAGYATTAGVVQEEPDTLTSFIAANTVTVAASEVVKAVGAASEPDPGLNVAVIDPSAPLPTAPLSPRAPSSPPPLPPRPGSGAPCACSPHAKAQGWVTDLARREGWAEESEEKKQLSLRIFAGTWNIAGEMLSTAEDLEEWLGVEVCPGESPPDLFAIGFQEVIDLSAGNVVADSFLDNQSRTNARRWLELIENYLDIYGKRHGVKYRQLSHKRLLGTYIVVMAEASLACRVTDVQRAHVATGIGGKLGNKGAVAIRMVIAREVSLCFVCCHMCAHRENVLQRNAEYRTVTERRLFRVLAHDALQTRPKYLLASQAEQRMGGLAALSTYAAAAVAAVTTPTSPSRSDDLSASASPPRRVDYSGSGDSGGGTIGILDHDVVVWLGDMNYRIGGTVTSEEVGRMVAAGETEALRELDQLSTEMAAGRAFPQFFEGRLSFDPTYKLIRGTRDFDLRPEKKMRCPSWCDRILWSAPHVCNAGPVQRMSLENYWSSGPYVSDHAPVSALFALTLSYMDNPQQQDRLMADKLKREWQEWSLAQVEELSLAHSTQSTLSLSPPLTNGDAAVVATATAALASLRIVAAPAVLTVQDIERNAVTSLFVQLIDVPPAAGAGGGDVQLAYHVCESSRPPWIQLSGASGTLNAPDTASDGLIEVDIDPSKIEFRPRANGGGYLPACAMLVITISDVRTDGGSGVQGNGGAALVRRSVAGEVLRRIVVPVICLLKE